MIMSNTKPTFFDSAAAWRAWLAKHHTTATEVLLGFYKASSKHARAAQCVTYSEALDEALCFGWIDAVRKTIDADRYTIRFTARKKGSIWSAINIARAEALIRDGRMKPAGLAAFERREEQRSRVYAYEQSKTAALDAAELRRFKTEKKAWAYFEAQPPWYRRNATHWITSAKKPETRTRRLEAFIAACAKGEWMPQWSYGTRKG